MSYKSRRIFKTETTSESEIKELLQFIFIAEILSPSKEIWFVTPWISDIPIFDNRSGLFDALDPSWGKREIKLIEIVLKILNQGTKIIIVTRPDEHCKKFLNKLFDQLDEKGIVNNLKIVEREDLHIKGILTDTSLLTGSMNITYNGLEILDEQVTFETAAQQISEARLAFESYI